MEERHGVVTSKGSSLTLLGPDLKVGSPVPEFVLLGSDFSPVSWSDLAGGTLLFNVVPSLDTGVCSLQTKRFNEELARLPGSVRVVTVSVDLPFAQVRFAAAEKVAHRILSDHRDLSFGTAFGVAIKELRLLARSVFVVGVDGRVSYREIVPEMSHQPNYEAALAAVRG